MSASSSKRPIPDRSDLEHYLHENIPLSKAMGITVSSLSLDEVVLKAPFQANYNHKCTVFGGSLNAITTLACWSLIYVNILEEKLDIVIAKSEISFLKSVNDDFEAICNKGDRAEWDHFMSTLKRKKKGRIHLESAIGDRVLFKGTFVALGRL